MSARVRLTLVIALAGITAWFAFSHRFVSRSGTGSANPIAALGDASGWLDGGLAPLDSLRGHPVLLVAWSDTDPRCLRLLREADAWQQAYGRFGLRVVGLHVPEYAFAADSAVPARALRRIGVRLPVALDAGSRVGSALGVGEELPLWIVLRSDGARTYEARGDRANSVQHAVLELLRDDHHEIPPLPVQEGGPKPARRVYCGTSRVADGPLKGAAPGAPQIFTAQFRYQEQGEAYTPYPVGRWTPSADGITSARGGASDYLAVRHEGDRVEAVIGAAGHARVWVMCDDGWLPEAERGGDVRVDARGATFVDLDGPRAYSVSRGGKAHVLRFSPEGPGVTFYEFAFGEE